MTDRVFKSIEERARDWQRLTDEARRKRREQINAELAEHDRRINEYMARWGTTIKTKSRLTSPGWERAKSDWKKLVAPSITQDRADAGRGQEDPQKRAIRDGTRSKPATRPTPHSDASREQLAEDINRDPADLPDALARHTGRVERDPYARSDGDPYAQSDQDPYARTDTDPYARRDGDPFNVRGGLDRLRNRFFGPRGEAGEAGTAGRVGAGAAKQGAKSLAGAGARAGAGAAAGGAGAAGAAAGGTAAAAGGTAAAAGGAAAAVALPELIVGAIIALVAIIIMVILVAALLAAFKGDLGGRPVDAVSAANASDMSKLRQAVCWTTVPSTAAADDPSSDDAKVLSPECIAQRRAQDQEALEVLAKIKKRVEAYTGENQEDKKHALEIIGRMEQEYQKSLEANGNVKQTLLVTIHLEFDPERTPESLKEKTVEELFEELKASHGSQSGLRPQLALAVSNLFIKCDELDGLKLETAVATSGEQLYKIPNDGTFPGIVFYDDRPDYKYANRGLACALLQLGQTWNTRYQTPIRVGNVSTKTGAGPGHETHFDGASADLQIDEITWGAGGRNWRDQKVWDLAKAIEFAKLARDAGATAVGFSTTSQSDDYGFAQAPPGVEQLLQEYDNGISKGSLVSRNSSGVGWGGHHHHWHLCVPGSVGYKCQ